MKNIFNIITAGCLVLATLYSCSKMDEYKKYVPDKPKVYPGMADSVTVLPGNNRVKLQWIHKSDPTITSAKVFWNGRADSVTVPVNRTQGVDTVSVIINNLDETSYTFDVFTYDKENNRSVPATKTGKVYGAKYHQALQNRTVTAVNLIAPANMLVVVWAEADTVNVDTKVFYTDAAGEEQVFRLTPDQNVTPLSWKIGTKVYYQSAYKPTANAIDTFTVLHRDSVTVTNVPVPKTAWSQVTLPNDIGTDAWGTNLSWIWDGKAADYPEIYHTDGSGMPHHFTFDLGAVYQLTQFENIGRQNSNPYHNPLKFEVWGIDDLAGAATTLPAGDPGWTNESIAKGWTLLKFVQRPDNGTAPYKVDLVENIPPVRYIRIRVLQVASGATDSHMSEVSFWFNP